MSANFVSVDEESLRKNIMNLVNESAEEDRRGDAQRAARRG